ncbi:MAG: aspartate kinase, partial [Chloroflexota bacterium]
MRLVMKFGGTSVSGGPRIQNVADLVCGYAQQGHAIVTVTSAMSGVTDTLIRAARHAAVGDDAVYLAAHETLTEQHFAALDHIIGDAATRDIARKHVTRLLDDFGNLCQSI